MRNHSYFSFLLVCVLISGLALSCSKNNSEETKKRVLDKPQAKIEKKIKTDSRFDVDKTKLNDPKEIEKLWTMPLSEVNKRLHSYRYKSKLTYTTKGGDKGVELTDFYEHEQAKNGDMHFRSYNDKVKKFELYYVGGNIFDRMSDYPFREQPKDGKQNFWMEKMYAGLITYYQYFRGFLNYGTPEATTYKGRAATKIPFTFNPAGKVPQDDLKLKFRFTNQYLLSARSFDHLNNTNRKMVTAHDEANGYLIMDNETSVLLSYEFHGKYRTKVSEERIKKLKASGTKNPVKEITFTMDGTYGIYDIGADITITAPPSAGKVERRKPALGPEGLLPKGIIKKVEPKGTKKTENKPEKK